MSSDDTTLEDLRCRLNDIDRRLLAIVAERKTVSGEVARVKRATGRPTRDYEREREVILGVRTAASELGVSPALAEDLDIRTDVPRYRVWLDGALADEPQDRPDRNGRLLGCL